MNNLNLPIRSSDKDDWRYIYNSIKEEFEKPREPVDPFRGIPWTPEMEEALKEELKNWNMEETKLDSLSEIEKRKLKDEEKWIREQTGQKKFRKNGNNRKKTRGRKRTARNRE